MIGYDTASYLWGRLDIPSLPHYVPAVRRAVERLGAQARLSPTDIDDLDLAVTEACANAIRHGSPERERNSVHIAFYLLPDAVMIEIRDEGPGFDVGAKAPPTPAALCDGGYGLHIMRQVVDRVEVDCGEGTTVRLIKARRGEIRRPGARRLSARKAAQEAAATALAA